jgi:hypothetical protein
MRARQVIYVRGDAAMLAPEVALITDYHRVDQGLLDPELRLQEPAGIVTVLTD